jgi:hypothetical protein
MGRKVNCFRKNNDAHVYRMTPCQHEFVEELAAMESIKRGRVVGKSEIIKMIVGERMRGEGYACGVE